MSSKSGCHGKLDKRKIATDYIFWCLRILAHLPRDDPYLGGLWPCPEELPMSNRTMRTWIDNSLNAKNTSTPFLADSAMGMARKMVEDDKKTAKDIWNALKYAYTKYNTHAVQNIRHCFESLAYRDDKDWKQHITR